jgi:hypothetical protein
MTGTALAQAFPLPGADPFYTPPANLASLANGAVIRERDVTLSISPASIASAAQSLGVSITSLLPAIYAALDEGFTTYQLLYKSTDGGGMPVAETATVLIPQAAWTGSGSRPLVSYQLAEDSTSVNCEPSYVLRTGLAAGGGGTGSVAAFENAFALTALTKGYGLVFSDYEGPQSEWLVGAQAAHGTLDGIRAALHYPRDGLSPSTPIGLWGYSGGGGATGWTAALKGSYAPELDVVGAAIGADSNANLASVFDYLDNTTLVGFDVIGIVGLTRANPSVDFAAYLTPQGAALIQSASDPDKCTLQELGAFAFAGRIENDTTMPAVSLPGLPPSRALIPANSLVGQKLTPVMPVLSYHDTFDDVVPLADDNTLAAQWCSSGGRVEVERFATPLPKTGLPIVHIAGEVEGVVPALAYLSDRFAGNAPRNDCQTALLWNSSLPVPYEPGVVQ